jgi:hypothetical protein
VRAAQQALAIAACRLIGAGGALARTSTSARAERRARAPLTGTRVCVCVCVCACACVWRAHVLGPAKAARTNRGSRGGGGGGGGGGGCGSAGGSGGGEDGAAASAAVDDEECVVPPRRGRVARTHITPPRARACSMSGEVPVAAALAAAAGGGEEEEEEEDARVRPRAGRVTVSNRSSAAATRASGALRAATPEQLAQLNVVFEAVPAYEDAEKEREWRLRSEDYDQFLRHEVPRCVQAVQAATATHGANLIGKPLTDDAVASIAAWAAKNLGSVPTAVPLKAQRARTALLIFQKYHHVLHPAGAARMVTDPGAVCVGTGFAVCKDGDLCAPTLIRRRSVWRRHLCHTLH